MNRHQPSAWMNRLWEELQLARREEPDDDDGRTDCLEEFGGDLGPGGRESPSLSGLIGNALLLLGLLAAALVWAYLQG